LIVGRFPDKLLGMLVCIFWICILFDRCFTKFGSFFFINITQIFKMQGYL